MSSLSQRPKAPSTPTKTRPPRSREANTARALLALLFSLYAAYLVVDVPRLTNNVLSDREFTGWVGPIAERFLRGERPYTDFVLPIPPGSFVLLALLQRLASGPLLIQELWVAGIAHLLMGALGYAIARCFSTRRVALMVAFTTLVLVSQTPKQCVYDHTSLIVAWSGLLTASRALTTPDPGARLRLWFATGFLSTLSLLFKQSTAAGLVVGVALACGYLVLVEAIGKRPEGVRGRLRGALACFAGGVSGLAAVCLVLLSLGVSIPSFVTAVLGDGPSLKGGTSALLLDLFTFTVRNDAIRTSLVPTVLVLVIGVAIARRTGSLHVGDERERDDGLEPQESAPRGGTLGRKAAWFLGLSFIGIYGGATALLVAEVRGLHRVFVAAVESLRNVPAYGFVFGAAFFAAHVMERHASTVRRRERGHALNAVLIFAAVASMIYDTSFVQFFPFYYNEPSIPLALLCLFVATERSGLRFASPLALVISTLPTFGVEFNRALSADTTVTSGHWASLRVNYRGVEVLRAAARARDLAGRDGAVLVLPEDVEFAALVHRPRPKLKGAIVFVDQYPGRLLAADLVTLDRDLPEVIVIHPHRRQDWKSVFATWSTHSAAEQLIDHVLDDVLPSHYVLDSTYSSIYFWDQGQIDVYVRNEPEEPGG